MSLIKLENTNANVFTVKGAPYLKGQYRLDYRNTDTTNATGEVSDADKAKIGVKLVALSKNLDPNVQEPWKGYKTYADFVDSTETAYADFDTFALALANMVALPNNAATSDLISDKGTVTQQTNVSTAVTSNTLSTKITSVSLTLTADSSGSFTFNNNKIATTSNIYVSTMYGGAGVIQAFVTAQASGSCTIKLVNVGTSTANAATVINVLVV